MYKKVYSSVVHINQNCKIFNVHQEYINCGILLQQNTKQTASNNEDKS